MPKEVLQPQLATFSLPPYFMLNALKTAVIFSAEWNGATTSGSSNPRSELREMTNNGLTLANWSGASGRHKMEVDLRVTRLDGIHEVVVAQIHGPDDDLTVFRLKTGNRLFITNGDDDEWHQVATYVPGPDSARIKLGFDVQGGQVRFTVNGTDTGFSLPCGAGNYFKTGCYLQKKQESGGATVELYGVKVEHS